MRRVSDKLRRFSSGRMALLSLSIFFLFGVLVLPRAAVRAEEVSGGAGSPDTTLFYSSQDLYKFAKIYGPEGRMAYVRARLTFDTAFPMVYGFFLVTVIGWLSVKLIPEFSRLKYLNLVPVAGVVLDLLENISLSIVMLRFPEQAPIFSALAPILSMAKWTFVSGSFIALVLIPIVWAVAILRSRMA